MRLNMGLYDLVMSELNCIEVKGGIFWKAIIEDGSNDCVFEIKNEGDGGCNKYTKINGWDSQISFVRYIESLVPDAVGMRTEAEDLLVHCDGDGTEALDKIMAWFHPEMVTIREAMHGAWHQVKAKEINP